MVHVSCISFLLQIDVVFDFIYYFGFCEGAYVDHDKPSSIRQEQHSDVTEYECKLHLQRYEKVNIYLHKAIPMFQLYIILNYLKNLKPLYHQQIFFKETAISFMSFTV